MLRTARTLAVTLVAVSALLTLTPPVARAQIAAHLAQDPIALAGAPFSGIGKAQSISTYPDGNRIVQTAIAHYYRDSQGRTRVEREFQNFRAMYPTNMPPEHNIVTVMIDDPVSGARYMLLRDQKLANVFQPPAGSVRPPQAAMPAPFPVAHIGIGGNTVGLAVGVPGLGQDYKTTDLGEKQIAGIKAVGIRRDYTLAAGDLGNEMPITVALEQWYSPDLGAVLFLSEHQSLGVDSTYQLQVLSRAEPDPALFTVPSDYTRRSSPTTATAIAIGSVQQPAVRMAPK